MPPLAADRDSRRCQRQPASARRQSSKEAEIAAALGTRSLVLVGMMGAGKSTIGRRLAARLGCRSSMPTRKSSCAAGMTIPEIFAAHGEPYFRDGEARVIARLLDGGPVVLATGGGAFMREETRSRIARKAVSVWLKADADVIMRRVRRRADRRCCRPPIPKRPSDACSQSASRSIAQADLTIGSRDVPHEKIVDECIEALHARLCGERAQPGPADRPTQ